MSGILGVWNLDGRPVDRVVLEAMAAAIEYRGPDGRAFDVDGPLGLGALLMRVTPESAEERLLERGLSGSVVLWDGRLDDRDALIARLAGRGRRLDAAAPDPELVLAAYEEMGDECFAALIGDFAFAIFDPREPHLLLCRDRIGMRTVAYTRAGDALIFASDIKALLAHPEVRTEPNDELIAELLADGWPTPYEGETFFRDISDVAPAEVVRIAPSGLQKRTYWSFDPSTRIRLDGFEEYAEALREVLERSVTRRMRSAAPVAISLSGGLDSSSLACLAIRSAQREGRPPPFGVHHVGTLGGYSDERTMVASVERHIGIVTHRIPLVRGGFFEHADHVARASEAPFAHPNALVDRSTDQTVRRMGGRVLVRGYGGDQLFGPVDYLADLLLAGRFASLARHVRELSKWNERVKPREYRRWLASQVARQLVPVSAIPALRRLRSRWRDQVDGDRIWSDRIVRLGRRSSPSASLSRRGFASRGAWGAVSEVYYAKRSLVIRAERVRLSAASGLELVYPFYDCDVVRFVAAIPPEIRSYEGVHRALLRRAMRGCIPDDVAERRWKADFTKDYRAAVVADAAGFLSVIAAGGGVVDRDYVIEPKVSEASKDGRAAVRSGVEQVFALDAWIRAFFPEIATVGA